MLQTTYYNDRYLIYKANKDRSRWYLKELKKGRILAILQIELVKPIILLEEDTNKYLIIDLCRTSK